MNTDNRIAYLISQLQNDVASFEEIQELRAAINSDDSGIILETIEALSINKQKNWKYDPQYWENVADEILNADKNNAYPNQKSKSKLFRFSWQAAAAAVILVIAGLSTYFIYFDKDDVTKPIVSRPSVQDKLPGSDKATLTLGNGRKIVLDNIIGNVAIQGNLTVINRNGQLFYDGVTGTEGLQFNTIATPRGGQYQVVLNDGTKVWLNAASSLRFPNTFIGDKRVVELAGEAYFEVAHNKNKPFFVHVNGMEIQVLGTHFNVQAYADEPVVQTTLLEGRVKVKAGNHENLLLPGQQSEFNKAGDLKMKKDINIDQTIAWKNGYFYFQKANVRQVMREMARWYNIEIQYVTEPTSELFVGKIQRDLTLLQVLELLKTSGINYQLKDSSLWLSN